MRVTASSVVEAAIGHGEIGMWEQLAGAVERQSDFAADVFERLRAISADGRGVTRASYGEGEQAAHALMSEIATDLGMTESAVKVAVHRLRKRYGEALRAEVAQTVSDKKEIDDEVRYLLTVVDS